MIFVSGKLQDYETFAAKNMDYIKGLGEGLLLFSSWQLLDETLEFSTWFLLTGLDHEQNIRKMRLLTFMMIADSQSTVDFKTVVSEMGVKESEVEQFVIDGQ